MRFWITKNGEVPLREQLVRQVVLGILSEDLPPGRKLPSVRALARRHHIHSNTVSTAYHDLLQQGWLELRRGSGLYVREPAASTDRQSELDDLLTTLLRSARTLGYEPDEVLGRLERLVRPVTYTRVLIVETEAAMREILQAELAEHMGERVHATSGTDLPSVSIDARTLLVALPTRMAKARQGLPTSIFSFPLRVRSMQQLLAGESRPEAGVVVMIVSRSEAIRRWARAMLVAVGLDPASLCEIDATAPAWRDRIGRGAFLIADIVVARELPADRNTHVFRVVADSALAERTQLCPA